MKRLFVVGCSFTQYYWPTWADILSQEYDYFENWGQPGLGNRAILERLTELVVHNKLTKDDTVIVQWTDFHRYDIHHRNPLRINFPNCTDGWNAHGTIFDNPKFSNEWIQTNWKEFSYMLHTYNYIKLGTCLLESLPCTWYVTFMNNLVAPMEMYEDLSAYKSIFPLTRMLPPINDFCKDYPKHILDNVEDPHPTPIAHYDYLRTFLVPNLDKTWAQKAEDLLVNFTQSSQSTTLFEKELNWGAYKYNRKGL